MDKKPVILAIVAKEKDISEMFDGVQTSKYATSICGQVCVCNCDVTPAAISNAKIL